MNDCDDINFDLEAGFRRMNDYEFDSFARRAMADGLNRMLDGDISIYRPAELNAPAPRVRGKKRKWK
jgi:hypothetical protein